VKYWIFRFSVQGKQHNMSLRDFPNLGVSEGQIKSEEAGEKLRQSITSVEESQAQIQEQPPSIIKPTFA